MQQPTILIVDDDKGQQLRLTTLLKQEGYCVHQATSGEEALASARATPPDLILSDVMMQGMDGYELAMSFKGDPQLSHIPIALQSSVFNDAKDRLLAEAIGVDDFFDKSVSVDELLTRLREIAGQPTSSTENTRFDEVKFQRMRARILTDKVGLKQSELENACQRADDSARQLQTITNALPDLICELDTHYRYRYVNRAYEQWHGKNNREIVGLTVEQLLGSENYAKVAPHLERAMRGETVEYEAQFNYPAKGKREMWLRYLPHYDPKGKLSGIHVVISDITERQQIQRQLESSNRGYLMLLQINRLISMAESEQALLQGACEIITNSGDFPLAWIGHVDKDNGKHVPPVAQSGFAQGYLESLQFSWDDNEYGWGPTGRAVRSGTLQVAEDIMHHPAFAPWRAQALQHGFASSIALPLLVEGEVVAVLNIYAPHPFAFSHGDTELLQKLAGDISHGIHTLRLLLERKQIELALRKANRAYRTLVSLKKSLANLHDEESLLTEVCQLLVESGSYRLAWIGFAERDRGKTIRPIASAGDDQHYLTGASFSWGENNLGRGPTGSAIRQGKTVIINNVMDDPQLCPWWEAAQRQGYASIIALPLKREGEVFGSLTLYAEVINAFYAEEVELLEEFAEELAVGISVLRQQNKHQQTEGELAYQRKLFEAVFRHIPDTMIITDTSHRIILSNTAVIRDFGYYPEELLGQSPARLYEDAEQFKSQQELRFHHGAAESYTPYTISYRRKDGECFTGETLGAAFRDRERRLLGYITIIRDISERKAMEGERFQLQMQLQQAQKMETVGQLTGGIAHDFNNILAAILGYTELAQARVVGADNENSARLARYLGEIQCAGGRARDIIAKLLAFSRTGGSEKRPIALGPLIEETASLLKPTLSSSIDLSVELLAEDDQILADPNQLHQVLMNLCINARDAMLGRGRIRIQLNRAPLHHGNCNACGEKFQGNYICLSISDNGSGIPDEVLSRMFDPFFTTKEIGKGSGMGLSMVHGIIHDHRGHIQVTTSPKGTTFDIYLPMQAEQEQHHDASPLIVVVDDQPSLVEFMEQLLLFNGYKVKGFTDPREARRALLEQQIPCDLVLTDLMMPGIDGNELARQLLAGRPELPLLLCSSMVDEHSEEQAREQGFSGFLPKPIESTRLISLLQKTLGTQRIPQRTRLLTHQTEE